jgi:hypothetical protein
MSELVLRVYLETMSTTTSKPHGFTEIKIVASIFFLSCHPSHSASWVIMEKHSAVKLPHKDWTIAPIIRRQAHEIKQAHPLQGINHKAIFGGLMHCKSILVDGLGHHNSTILHALLSVIVIITQQLLGVGPEKFIFMGVSGFLESIGVLLSKSSPGTNMYCANIVSWQSLNKVIILCCLFIFLPFGN